MEPSFFIAGTRKGGSTFLYRILALHPQVREPILKEINYLSIARINGTGIPDIDVYRSFFPKASGSGSKKLITGESSPHYMFYPHVAEVLAEAFPRAKVLLMLRDPASRAYSEYRMNVNRGVETLSFEDAIVQEQDRTEEEWNRWLADPASPSKAVAEFSYQRRGLYLEQIKRLEQHFPKEQILVLRSNSVWKEPKEALLRVEEFLGLDPWVPKKIVPENVGTTKTKPNPETMRCLREYFEPHDKALFDYLGWEGGW